MAKGKVTASTIKHALSQRHKDEFFLTECKTGETWGNDALQKFDALSIKKSWASPCFTGYEVKVDRQDFLRDDKWPGYKNYCHRLYFACPTGLIKPEELPDDVGLVWYNPEKGTLFTKKKAPFRDIEVPAPMLYYILMSRLDSERHPFYSSTREFLEEYVADKVEARKLGVLVGTKLAQQVQSLAEEKESLEWRMKRYKEASDQLDELSKLTNEIAGFNLRWHPEKLAEVLRAGVSDNVMRQVELLTRESQRLLHMIGSKQETA